MSLKAFKETLHAPCSGAGSETDAGGIYLQQILDAKKPPKGSLKDRIVSLDRFRSVDGRSLNSLGLARDSSHDLCEGSLEERHSFVDNPKRKRKVFEQLFETQPHNFQADDVVSEREVTGGPILKRCSGDAEGLLKQNSGVCARKYEGESTSDLKHFDGKPQLRPDVLGLAADDHGVEDEDFLDVGRDSEAGLFIQSEAEGLFEPLILWQPSEGRADGSPAAPAVQVPACINSRLLEHQREGVRFLYNLYRENKGGVLGDDMGLGKTIQSIAFLAAVLNTGSDADFVSNVGKMEPSHCEEATAGNSGELPSREVALVICPTSVIQNWEREFEAWGTFQLGIYHGSQRESILEKIHANKLDIIVTSHDTFRMCGNHLSEVSWEVVIVDEAHRLKNEKSQLYKACLKMRTKKRYGLTGTIIQNRLMDLFNVFDWAAPGCLGARDHFKDYYDEPIKQGQRISAPERFVEIAEQRKQQLRKVLQKYLLRRTKQETLGHLMRGKEDNVMFCAMSTVQKHAYKRLLQSPDFQCLINKDSPCTCGSPLSRAECCYRIAPSGIIWSYLHRDNPEGCDSCPYCLLLPCLTKLQQVSNHLELLKPNLKDEPEKQKKDAAFALLAFGEDAELLGGTQQEESFLGLSDAQHCGKMLALQKLLASWISKGDKVLLFSYSVKMLDILNKFLIRKGYSFSRLDGSTPMAGRQAVVDDFNNSPSTQVFLISTRAGGLGLNLVSANRVVIFDPNWNPAQDQQAQDRSFRYGQQRHVTVFRLLAAGSLEELVYTRQIYKQQLFNIAVSGSLEKRYFEGVQDSRVNKGELFGIGNLFRDLSDQVFTSDLINSHEERLRKAAKSSIGSVSRQMESNKMNATGCESLYKVENVVLSDVQKDRGFLTPNRKSDLDVNEECMREETLFIKDVEGVRGESLFEKEFSNVLAGAGVVYTHRNEEVVNLKMHAPKQQKVLLKKSELKTAFGGVPGYSNASAVPLKRMGTVQKLHIRAAPAMLDKNQQFQELAKSKGLTEREFSRWCLTATPAELEKLFEDYQQSLMVVQ
ncbi:hypothetical protein O6H91_04G055200 [Diphasiastrum complanatum]|uniref:Uncharacterized protein n=2 Tax=Diphasiastrum complanatum TaxID=34168 RepID=A0ACC2DX51_DIPCM|nr:hypothetical protein O6H91_04G055200 [Diphasiastrum complanatum]KAJ7558774.1 hypothetical protein O6H91_04G055200 [Diphasiastrum complanatum]